MEKLYTYEDFRAVYMSVMNMGVKINTEINLCKMIYNMDDDELVEHINKFAEAEYYRIKATLSEDRWELFEKLTNDELVRQSAQPIVDETKIKS